MYNSSCITKIDSYSHVNERHEASAGVRSIVYVCIGPSMTTWCFYSPMSSRLCSMARRAHVQMGLCVSIDILRETVQYIACLAP
jgi:hypothetical protein